MAYTGQPVPSTVYNAVRAKVSDGKSVRVAVPEKTKVEAGKFYLLDGFFGAAMQSVTTGEGETAEVVLNIEQAEYETDQINTAQDFKPGTVIYWDGEKFTQNADDGEEPANPYRKAGRVTVGKDDNNVIWFILGPQV